MRPLRRRLQRWNLGTFTPEERSELTIQRGLVRRKTEDFPNHGRRESDASFCHFERVSQVPTQACSNDTVEQKEGKGKEGPGAGARYSCRPFQDTAVGESETNKT